MYYLYYYRRRSLTGNLSFGLDFNRFSLNRDYLLLLAESSRRER